MKNNEHIKYTSDEILQILIDFYNFQSNFDSEVDKGHDITFQTTIEEWRNICDLVELNKLAKYYYELFELKTNQSDLIDMFSGKNECTLREFCEYIAQHASKEKINPVMSLGASCQEAAIFKTLKIKLEEKGIDTKNFKPSTEFIPFFNKHAAEVVEIVSKLSPGSFTEYNIKNNVINRIGAVLFLFAIVILIGSSILHKFTWFLFIPLAVALLLLFIGNKLKAAQYEIGGYHTIRDLIMGMKGKAKDNVSGKQQQPDNIILPPIK